MTRSWYDHREPDNDQTTELNDVRYDLNNNNKSEEELKEGLGWGNIRELPVSTSSSTFRLIICILSVFSARPLIDCILKMGMPTKIIQTPLLETSFLSR